MSEHDLVPRSLPPAHSLEDLDRASRAQTAQHFRARNTRKIYESAWSLFTAWCARVGRTALPAEPSTVRLYIQYCLSGRDADYQAALEHYGDPRHPRVKALPRQNLTTRSIGVHLAAINLVHRLNRFPKPLAEEEVATAWQAARRAPATPVGRGKKKALTRDDLLPLVRSIRGNSLLDVRDRALLVLAFLSGRRRSEIAAMTMGSLTFDEEGIVYNVGSLEYLDTGIWARLEKTKTDQFGERFERIYIPRGKQVDVDPVTLLHAWLRRAGIREGWVWRSCSNRNIGQLLTPESIRVTIRRRVLSALISWLDEHARFDAAVAELRDANAKRFVRSRFTSPVVARLLHHYGLPATYDPDAYGAHSTRSGFTTSAREAGHPDAFIMDQTGHKTARMLNEYTHSKQGWKNNAARGLLDAVETERNGTE